LPARPCSLLRHIDIVPGGLPDWHYLAEYHYRQSHPGLVDKIFVMRLHGRPRSAAWQKLHRRRDELVGVIVYGMPKANVALRHVATGGRYAGWSDRAALLRLLNQEVRCINRVVIRPEFRGMGLARRLVAHTLPLAGTVHVEALAVMSRVNPFFEHAGMTRYEGDMAPSCRRLLDAFACFDIDAETIADPRTLLHTLHALPVAAQDWLIIEMQRFAHLYLHPQQLLREQKLAALAHCVSGSLLCRPVYFLWKRPDTFYSGEKHEH